MIYNQLGESRIRQVVALMYKNAFCDGIIGHFFFGLDQDALIQQQTRFLVGLFGGPKNYSGREMAAAHRAFIIKEVHFRRRRQILKEALEANGIEEELRKKWLAIEDRFKNIIINDDQDCH